MNYRRGDIVIVKYPFADTASYKKRPALIISNRIVNETGDFLMIQITSVDKNDQLSIPLIKDDFINGVDLPLNSYIRYHKIFLLNENLIIAKKTAVTNAFLKKIFHKIIEVIE